MGIKQIAEEIFKQADDLKKLLGEEEKEVDFEAYLMDKFVEDEPQVLDDMIPDAFEDWMQDISVDEVVEYAQEYAEKIYKNN